MDFNIPIFKYVLILVGVCLLLGFGSGYVTSCNNRHQLGELTKKQEKQAQARRDSALAAAGRAYGKGQAAQDSATKHAQDEKAIIPVATDSISISRAFSDFFHW